MVRPPSVDSNGMKKGAWSEEEDNKLRAYIQRYGHWNWRLLPKYAGLARCGKSCRLRWVNYLKPGVKKGNFTKQEEDHIVQLQAQLGNRWSAIAKKLPGRTDNEIKNFYHTRIEKRRTRNRAVKKVNNEHTNEAFPKDVQELEEEIKPSQVTNPSSSITDSQMNNSMWNIHDIFDLSNSQDDYILSPLPEQDFLYSEALHYTTELSSSETSYLSALDWIADDGLSIHSSDYLAQMQHENNLWAESFSSNNSNSQSGSSYFSAQEGVYDPFLQYFDHAMNF